MKKCLLVCVLAVISCSEEPSGPPPFRFPDTIVQIGTGADARFVVNHIVEKVIQNDVLAGFGNESFPSNDIVNGLEGTASVTGKISRGAPPGGCGQCGVILNTVFVDIVFTGYKIKSGALEIILTGSVNFEDSTWRTGYKGNPDGGAMFLKIATGVLQVQLTNVNTGGGFDDDISECDTQGASAVSMGGVCRNGAGDLLGF